MERGKRSKLEFIGDDGFPEGCTKFKRWDIADSVFSKEFFVDFDECRKEFLIYLIDHERKVYVPYFHQYAIGLYDLILRKCKKFNTGFVGLYGIKGGMSWLYENLCSSENIIAYDRPDIYEWRMSLDNRVRSVTRPIFYYEDKRYSPISEAEYWSNILL